MSKRLFDDSFKKMAIDLSNSRGSVKEVADELGISMGQVFRDVVSHTYSDTNSIFAQERNQLITQVTEQNNKITQPGNFYLRMP